MVTTVYKPRRATRQKIELPPPTAISRTARTGLVKAETVVKRILRHYGIDEVDDDPGQREFEESALEAI